MQVIPTPYYQASFQRDGVKLTRYRFGPGLALQDMIHKSYTRG